MLDEGKDKISVSYAYIALADYRFIAAHVERERPAVAEPVFVTSVVADAGFGRACLAPLPRAGSPSRHHRALRRSR